MVTIITFLCDNKKNMHLIKTLRQYKFRENGFIENYSTLSTTFKHIHYKNVYPKEHFFYTWSEN